MIFFIHPLTIFILPIILAVYLTYEKEKRIKIMYKINDVEKHRRTSRPHILPLERREILESLYKDKARKNKEEEERNLRRKED